MTQPHISFHTTPVVYLKKKQSKTSGALSEGDRKIVDTEGITKCICLSKPGFNISQLKTKESRNVLQRFFHG